ncbi:SDR family oxidoreductase [Polaromonas sp. C04]|uniref:UDP-glucose 4-epimerase family protein n=1 Tax=Polaromonas sp. C04 TaxID=1945857 RepID=UPI0009D16FB4|nr:SDR family oxidoreductase [Polaromonas sp. C04]OOG50601.1 NAD-dependent dehydratase [Polaromonas sp. C04]
MKILVTGASGFIGSALVRRLQLDRRNALSGTARDGFSGAAPGAVPLFAGDLAPTADWRGAVAGMDVIVHTAARVHLTRDTATNALMEHRYVNTAGTLNLARQAAAAHVRRFIFLSSIGVNGAETFTRPFVADGTVVPHSPYAVSKHEAELGLRALTAETGMEVVIIRPPLVYGPGAPGNFSTLIRWLRRGVPLPLGAIHNQRSFVGLDNLLHLIEICLCHPAAENQTFLVSDGEDLSTTQLLQRMGQALGKPARLIPVPPMLIKLGAALVGKPDVAQRLCDSLQVDISKTRQLLGWSPPVSVDEGLKKAAQGYLA